MAAPINTPTLYVSLKKNINPDPIRFEVKEFRMDKLPVTSVKGSTFKAIAVARNGDADEFYDLLEKDYGETGIAIYEKAMAGGISRAEIQALFYRDLIERELLSAQGHNSYFNRERNIMPLIVSLSNLKLASKGVTPAKQATDSPSVTFSTTDEDQVNKTEDLVNSYIFNAFARSTQSDTGSVKKDTFTKVEPPTVYGVSGQKKADRLTVYKIAPKFKKDGMVVVYTPKGSPLSQVYKWGDLCKNKTLVETIFTDKMLYSMLVHINGGYYSAPSEEKGTFATIHGCVAPLVIHAYDPSAANYLSFRPTNCLFAIAAKIAEDSKPFEPEQEFPSDFEDIVQEKSEADAKLKKRKEPEPSEETEDGPGSKRKRNHFAPNALTKDIVSRPATRSAKPSKDESA